jgi:hypothetical protein
VEAAGYLCSLACALPGHFPAVHRFHGDNFIGTLLSIVPREAIPVKSSIKNPRKILALGLSLLKTGLAVTTHTLRAARLAEVPIETLGYGWYFCVGRWISGRAAAVLRLFD